MQENQRADGKTYDMGKSQEGRSWSAEKEARVQRFWIQAAGSYTKAGAPVNPFSRLTRDWSIKLYSFDLLGNIFHNLSKIMYPIFDS